MPDLRDWWINASPRERDAKVAEALGWRLYGRPRGWNPGLSIVPPEGAASVALDPFPWDRFDDAILLRDSPALAAYSTSWEHAGGLVDLLQREGWTVRSSVRPANKEGPAHAVVSCQLGARVESSERRPSASEATALAFVLSRESQS